MVAASVPMAETPLSSVAVPGHPAVAMRALEGRRLGKIAEDLRPRQDRRDLDSTNGIVIDVVGDPERSVRRQPDAIEVVRAPVAGALEPEGAEIAEIGSGDGTALGADIDRRTNAKHHHNGHSHEANPDPVNPCARERMASPRDSHELVVLSVVHEYRSSRPIENDRCHTVGSLRPPASPARWGCPMSRFTGFNPCRSSRKDLYCVVMKIILHRRRSLSVLATPTRRQQTPPTPEELALFEAAYTGKLADVERLVAAGTTVDAVDAENRTPMMFAAFNGHRQVVSFLLTQGAEVDSKDASGRTGLMYAASGPFVETVEVLLDAGAEVNTQGSLEGFTALMTAAAEGQIEVVRLLLERGADPTLKDVDGDTALSFARQAGHTAVVEILTKSAAKGERNQIRGSASRTSSRSRPSPPRHS